jgi:hypothetical protein
MHSGIPKCTKPEVRLQERPWFPKAFHKQQQTKNLK